MTKEWCGGRGRLKKHQRAQCMKKWVFCMHRWVFKSFFLTSEANIINKKSPLKRRYRVINNNSTLRKCWVTLYDDWISNLIWCDPFSLISFGKILTKMWEIMYKTGVKMHESCEKIMNKNKEEIGQKSKNLDTGWSITQSSEVSNHPVIEFLIWFNKIPFSAWIFRLKITKVNSFDHHQCALQGDILLCIWQLWYHDLHIWIAIFELVVNFVEFKSS